MADLTLHTKVDIKTPSFSIKPTNKLLFVGSCFADGIGRRFSDWQFNTEVNPYGVMYNPASIMHTIKRWTEEINETAHDYADVVVFTLGTNHVYILNETGKIVDNCQKRPQYLFTEKRLTISECVNFLSDAIETLKRQNSNIQIILTVSPIRYAKYGFHESQLSKSTLLLAADIITQKYDCATYFPAYEIVNDELRDYRFYKPDMIHPSEQAVDYIFNSFCEKFLSNDAISFMKEWAPIQKALQHRPFNPNTAEYKKFLENARNKEKEFKEKWLCK